MLVPTTEEEKKDYAMAEKCTEGVAGSPYEREVLTEFHFATYRLYRVCGYEVARRNFDSVNFALEGMKLAKKAGIL